MDVEKAYFIMLSAALLVVAGISWIRLARNPTRRLYPNGESNDRNEQVASQLLVWLSQSGRSSRDRGDRGVVRTVIGS